MKTPLRTLLIALAAIALQALMITAFAWPAVRIAPREVPLVVAGPAPAATEVMRRLDAGHHGAFRLERLPDEDAARRALADRAAYGAIVVGPAGPHMLIASAAGPVVAQSLTQLAQQLSGRPVEAPQDVVPADPHDPRGAGLGALVLPLIMSGMAGGVLLVLLVGSALWRAAGLIVFAAGAGAASAAVARTGLSMLPGPYLGVAGVIALATLAVAGAVAGLGTLIGRPGLGLGAAVMILLANPLSGVTSAPELLPRPWGAIGQDLPAGAGATLLRSVAFFDGARSGSPLMVLLIWAGGGRRGPDPGGGRSAARPPLARHGRHGREGAGPRAGAALRSRSRATRTSRREWCHRSETSPE